MTTGFPAPLDPGLTPRDALAIPEALAHRRVPLGARLALVALQLGAVLVVLAAGTWRTFELDRFFVPKELVLHATALLAAPLALGTARGWGRSRVDHLLVLWLALGLLSAVVAGDRWAAWRAIAISVSGILLYWAARVVSRAGLQRPLLAALGLAVALAAGGLLLQAYGVQADVFSVNRAPGGTFGNRNFVAHVAAIGAPLLVLLVLEARSAPGAAAWLVALAATSAALVLSRSRAAWLAAMTCAGVMLLAGRLGRARWRHGTRARRVRLLLAGALVGVLAAFLLPNTLDWRSESPYLDSVRGVVNYREGSGAGRLVQWRTSLRLVARHPVLGVGPGNWPAAYPAVAGRGDPSLARDDRVTANPWPSSDWVAFVTERGTAATAALLLALLGVGGSALLGLRDARRPEEYLAALTVAATLVATLVVGAFDAVLLLAAPTLLVWTLLGALAPPAPAHAPLPWAPGGRRRLAALAVLLALAATLRSASQLSAMAVADGATAPRTLERAARLDPGSYRIRLRAAQAWQRRGDCRRALPHARAARARLPEARAPRRVLARCGG